MQLVFNLLCQLLPWALFLTVTLRQVGAVVDDPAAKQLRKALDVKHDFLPDHMDGESDEKKKKHDKRVMDAISQFRAEICFKMKKEHGTDFASHEACEEFMQKACHPGRDDQMDGGKKEVTSEKGYCSEYFPQAKKQAEEIVHHQEEEEELEIAKEASLSHGPSPFPAPAPAPKPAAAAPAGAGPAPGPAPGPMGAPAPGPVPGPFIPGISAGKPWGTIKDDEAWYYKKGGKDDGRLHMSESMKLPTQGYWGKLVEHEDMKSVTSDWGREFGPQAGHQDIRAICAQHPENPWCYEQGYHRHHKSSCATLAAMLPLVCTLFAVRAL